MPEVISLNAPLGARIEGLDRSRANEPAVAALLDKALAEHLLVVIPGAPMTAEATRDFSRAFGEPREQLLRYKRSGGVPEVSVMRSASNLKFRIEITTIARENGVNQRVVDLMFRQLNPSMIKSFAAEEGVKLGLYTQVLE